MAATTAAGTGRCRALSSPPTAAPNTGPASTFCGRIPSRPPSPPVTAPTVTGPARPVRPAAQPSGATRAALVAIRCHKRGDLTRALPGPRHCLRRRQQARSGRCARAGGPQAPVTGQRRPGYAADGRGPEDLPPPLPRLPRLA